MAQSDLAALLASREARRGRVSALLNEYAATVVVLTLNIPGADKVPPFAGAVVAEGIRTVTAVCSDSGGLLHNELLELPTGFEWYAVLGDSGAEIKRRMISVEESHPLGRLFDIDVHAADGTPCGREALDIPPRRCLICERPAHECGRSRRHALAELLEEIEARTVQFFGEAQV